VKSGQGKSSRFVKTADRGGFGSRLREAFGGVTNAEIARKMRRSEPAVKNYIDGRIPSADHLVSISHLTGCSVHWLLTGEGPKLLSGAVSIPEISARGKLGDRDREMVVSLIAALEHSLKE
jgi:hypothetical protein